MVLQDRGTRTDGSDHMNTAPVYTWTIRREDTK
jgi:hypothetical protein